MRNQMDVWRFDPADGKTLSALTFKDLNFPPQKQSAAPPSRSLHPELLNNIWPPSFSPWSETLTSRWSKLTQLHLWLHPSIPPSISASDWWRWLLLLTRSLQGPKVWGAKILFSCFTDETNSWDSWTEPRNTGGEKLNLNWAWTSSWTSLCYYCCFMGGFLDLQDQFLSVWWCRHTNRNI